MITKTIPCPLSYTIKLQSIYPIASRHGIYDPYLSNHHKYAPNGIFTLNLCNETSGLFFLFSNPTCCLLQIGTRTENVQNFSNFYTFLHNSLSILPRSLLSTQILYRVLDTKSHIGIFFQISAAAHLNHTAVKQD
jgi:hypothetical protein